MKPFFKIARKLTQYPAALCASLGCSLAVAFLWGGNIGAVYPILEVCLRGKSVQQWVADDITEARDKQYLIVARLVAQPAYIPATEARMLRAEFQSLQNSIATRKRIQPYTDFLPDDPFRTVAVFVGLLLAATALKNLFIVGSLVTTSWAVQRATLDLQNDYTKKVLAMDLASYDRFGTSELVTHFTESIEHISRGLRVLLGASVREPLKILSCGIGAALISWRLMLFTLLIAPVAAILIGALSRKIRRTLKGHVSDSVHLNRLIFQSVISLPTVQAYGMEKELEREVDLAGKDRMKRSIKISLWIALTKPVTELAGIMAVGLAIVAGGYLVLNQQTQLFGIQMTDQPLTMSSMLVFFGMMVGMSDPARKLTDVFSNLQIGIAAADRVDEVLVEQSQLTFNSEPSEPAATPVKAGPGNCGIEFDGVSFGYSEDQLALDAVSLNIQPGETVCLVGPNGCGKSTLGKLLMRFYDPVSGRVLMDGNDISEQDPKEVRRRISFVSQSPVLIEDTVAANIRFGTPGATDDQIREMAKLARADAFIQELENTYEYAAGFDGNRLSGGQKQRIVLARAFLRNPDLLILDEATNQIDQHSEQLIYEALREFITDRTCIFVSHRPEAFKLCDRIIVMDEGRVIASGTQQELMQTCKAFRKLFGDFEDQRPMKAAA